MNQKEYQDLIKYNKNLGLTSAQIQTELKKLTAERKKLVEELKTAKMNKDPNYGTLEKLYQEKIKEIRQRMNAWSGANTQANLKENP
jgi:hypothetical protein